MTKWTKEQDRALTALTGRGRVLYDSSQGTALSDKRTRKRATEGAKKPPVIVSKAEKGAPLSRLMKRRRKELALQKLRKAANLLPKLDRVDPT